MSPSRDTLFSAFVDPGASPPQRLPAFPNVEQSAVTSLRQDFTLASTVTDTVTAGHRVLLLRQPSYPVLADQSTVSGWLWGTCIPIHTTVVPSDTTFFWSGEAQRDYGFTSDNNLYTAVPTGLSGPGYRVRVSGTTPGGCAVVGMSSGYERPFVYIPPLAGSVQGSLTLVAVMTSPNGALTTFDAVTNGGFVQVNLETAEGSGRIGAANIYTWTGTFQPVNSNPQCVFLGTTTTVQAGWYRVGSITVKGTPGTTDSAPEFCDIWLGYAGTAGVVSTTASNLVTVSPNVTNALLPVFKPIETATTHAHLLGTRCTALSLSAANVSQVMTKEGVVQAGRLPTNKSLWGFTKAMISTLPPTKRFQGPLEIGFYAVLPPTSDLDTWLDFAFTHPVHGTMPAFNLDSGAEAIALSLNDPSGGVSQTPFSLAMQLCMHLEFRCYSQLWPTAMSRRPIEELHKAVVDAVVGGFCFARTGYKPARQLQGVLAVAPVGASRGPAARPRRARAPRVKREGPITRAKFDRLQRRKEKRKQARKTKRT